jgi:hypothetical protein
VIQILLQYILLFLVQLGSDDRLCLSTSLPACMSSLEFFCLHRLFCMPAVHIISSSSTGASPCGFGLPPAASPPVLDSWNRHRCSPLSFLRKLAVPLPLASVPSNFIFFYIISSSIDDQKRCYKLHIYRMSGNVTTDSDQSVC